MGNVIRSGTIVDVAEKKMFPGTITVSNGIISDITVDPFPKTPYYIMPGFIDAHIHIESSLLIPSEFARMASIHGTVATVSDPHEIGNVLGLEGIRFMIQNAKKVPFHFFFGASSCVPATSFETAGSRIGPKEIEQLFDEEGLLYLSEMMNYPGVLNEDPDVMAKILIAQARKKPIDGHAPGLKGKIAHQYIQKGISTDHECYTLEEALDKISFGMKIIIREGSAAKNYTALHSLLHTHPEMVMFCSDDKHPHELEHGHINEVVRRSIQDHGYDLMNVLQAACLHPIHHYGLNVGYLKKGQSADFIVVQDLKQFEVLETYVQGIQIADHGKSLISPVPELPVNRWNVSKKQVSSFSIPAPSEGSTIRVIEAIDGQIITKASVGKACITNGELVPNLSNDILKICVVNRYDSEKRPACAFIKGFGLQQGAIATSVAHDSHNIVAVGVDDESLTLAVNLIIESKGGICVVSDSGHYLVPLPVAGLMTTQDGKTIASSYKKLLEKAKNLGSSLNDPFMTLSFMALLVIPELKLSDLGLFDATNFSFTNTSLS